MNKILKIATLSLPILALAPVVSLSTTNNTSSKNTINETQLLAGSTLTYKVTDKSYWHKDDRLSGTFTIAITNQTAGKQEFDVTLKITGDNGEAYDDKFTPWDYAFHMTVGDDLNTIGSKNGKAYFQCGFEETYYGIKAHLNVQSARSVWDEEYNYYVIEC